MSYLEKQIPSRIKKQLNNSFQITQNEIWDETTFKILSQNIHKDVICKLVCKIRVKLCQINYVDAIKNNRNGLKKFGWLV